MDQAIQKGACGEHDRPAAKAQTQLRDGAGHPIALDDQVVNRLLKNPQVRLILQAGANGLPVEHPIRLGAGGSHRRAFARIEDAELDTGLIGGSSHRAAQRVDLFDEMTLADTPDRGVTGHLAEGFHAVRQQQGGSTHAGTGQGGLGACMTAANHDDIELLWIVHGDA